MKAGTTIQEMATQLKGQSQVAQDFIVPSPKISLEMREPLLEVQTDSDVLDRLLARVASDPNGQPVVGEGVADYTDYAGPQMGPHIVLEDSGVFKPNRIFHQQMATLLKIPSAYYQRQFHSHPDDLVRDVNSWLHDTVLKDNVIVPVHGDRMIRTIGNTGRALLSSKYRRLDNLPLMLSLIETLDDLGVTPEDIVSCDVTEKKMYLKVLTPRLEGEIEKGDIVQAGLVVSNSEVGQGSLQVQPLIMRLVCMNGAIMADSSMRKTHLGGRIDADADEGWRIYSDETVQKSDEAFFAQVKDVVKHTLSENVFNMEVEKIKAANSEGITVEIPKAVERLSSTYSLTEKEGDAVLDNFITGKNFTKWGMANAITLASQADEINYDRATEMERMGGQVIEMPASNWASIAE